MLSTDNYNIGDDESQYLADTSQELTEKFTPKRKAAEILAGSYKRLGKGFEGRAARVENCGTCLGFSLSGGVPLVSDSERTPKPSPARGGGRRRLSETGAETRRSEFLQRSALSALLLAAHDEDIYTGLAGHELPRR